VSQRAETAEGIVAFCVEHGILDAVLRDPVAFEVLYPAALRHPAWYPSIVSQVWSLASVRAREEALVAEMLRHPS
jgi:hypothetical protein